MDQPPLFGPGFGTVWNFVFWIVRAIAIIAAAYFVYHSAIRRKHATLNIGPNWWVLFTIAGGIWTLLVYWLMEHSTLSGHRDENAL